jgi:hypothetical protein
MHEHPPIHHLSIPHTEGLHAIWTPETATKLLFLSFRHSQGSPELQRWLLDYVRSVSGQLLLPERWEAPIKRSLSKAISTYLDFSDKQNSAAPHHKPVSYDLLTHEVYRSYESMQQALTRSTALFTQKDIVYMTTVDMLKRDRAFLIEQAGRPRAAGMAAGEPFHSDASFSFIRYYALEHHATGLAVFDGLYQDIDDLIHASRQTHQNVTAANASPWDLSPDELDFLDNLLTA